MKKRINHLQDYFLPAKPFKSNNRLYRHKMFVLISFVTALYALVFFPISWLIAYKVAFIPIAITVILCIAYPFLLKRDVNLAVIVNAYLMTICGLTIWLMLVTGGLTHYPENPAFLLVLPVIALLCINRIAAIVWLAIAVLILCAFGIATINGIQFPMSMNQKYIALFEVFSFPGLVILTFVFVIIFDNAKNAALGKLEGQAKVIAWEKQKSEELLLNILPSGVADELKENGKAKAHRFDDVSILFTDFVNFTGTAEQMTAEQLVQELHECFTAFDLIMEKYGMEKIKTVGDAYLAVCGLPAPDPEHARKTVLAALDIRDFIEERKKQENAFSIRIGIHSGSVVAGIVGVKKFAYDIWGDTVNTAARMEQSGESGKVNISGTTYEFIKDQFNCVYRGEIAAKNKGKMNMYFVAGTINH